MKRLTVWWIVKELVRFVRDADHVPVQRVTFYDEVRRW
jgi:hypothetical protein